MTCAAFPMRVTLGFGSQCCSFGQTRSGRQTVETASRKSGSQISIHTPKLSRNHATRCSGPPPASSNSAARMCVHTGDSRRPCLGSTAKSRFSERKWPGAETVPAIVASAESEQQTTTCRFQRLKRLLGWWTGKDGLDRAHVSAVPGFSHPHLPAGQSPRPSFTAMAISCSGPR